MMFLMEMITALQDGDVIVRIHVRSHPPKPVQRDQSGCMLSDRE
jgi:hypothetical protein